MLQCLCKAMQIASACCGATCLPAVPGACSYCCDAACLLACCPAHAAALQPRAAASMLRAAGPGSHRWPAIAPLFSSPHAAQQLVAAVHAPPPTPPCACAAALLRPAAPPPRDLATAPPSSTAAENWGLGIGKLGKGKFRSRV